MKKLLRTLGTMALCANTSLSIIGCSSPNSDTQAVDLSTIIEIKNLDVIAMQGSSPDKAELLKGIKAKNPDTAKDLTVDDFDFKTTPTATDAIITGIGKYKDDVTLKYVKQIVKIDLNSIIKNKELDPIVIKGSSPDKAELLIGIKAKNPNTAKDLTVDDFDFKTTPTATDAIITGTGDYKGDVTLTYTRETDLKKYITTPDLNVIKTSGLTKPTPNQIIAALTSGGKNPDLDPSAITILVQDIDYDHAIITPLNLKYTDSVQISYTVDKSIINLDEVITTPDLKTIKTRTDIPSVDQIKDALTSGGKNPGLDISAVDFSIPSATSVIITGQAGKYNGSVQVSYTVDKPIMDQELNDIIGATIRTNTLLFNNNKWYVGCSNGRIYRYDENFTNPQVVVDLTTKTSVEEMIFVNNKWYVGCGNGKIYCFDEAFTEKSKIEVLDLGKIIDAITVVNDKWYVGCYDKNIYRFDLDKDGKFINKNIVFALNEEPDVIVFNNNKWYVGNNSGKIYRFDEDFTNKKEVADLKENIDTMIFHNNKWYVGCSDGKIYCFDQYFGNKQVFSNLESGHIYSLFEKNNQLYIMTNKKNIFEFNY